MGGFFLMVFGFVVVVLALLAGLALAIFRMIQGGDTKNDQPGEAKEIQQMHQDLMRMAERIEALETILLERDGKDGRNEA